MSIGKFERSHMCWPKLLISVAILLVIGLHILPNIQKLQGKEQTFWPVMAWGMYRNSRGPGPIWASLTQIIGVTARGEKIWVDERSFVGLSFFAVQRLFVGPMLGGDSSAAQRLANQLNRNREDPFAEILLERDTYTITDTGVLKENSLVNAYQVTP